MISMLSAEKYRWSEYHKPGYEWSPKLELFKSWNEVLFVNSGQSEAKNVKATITCAPVKLKIVNGVVNVGDIPAGRRACSLNFFELETDTTNLQDIDNGIDYTVKYDSLEGIHHSINNNSILR